MVPLIPGTVVRVCCFCVVLAIPFTLVQAQQPAPEDVVLDLLGSQGWRAFELARLRERDPWLEDKPVYQGLWLRGSGAADSSVFDLLPFASAPRRRAGTALAYDQGIGSRMWSGFTETDPTRSAVLGTAARGLLGLWRQISGIGGGEHDLLAARPCPGMRVRLGSEALFGFGTDGRDTPRDTRALIVYADCQRDVGGDWHVSMGLRGYQWRTPGQPDRHDLESAVRIAHVPQHDGAALFVDASWTPHYHRATLHIERPVGLVGIRFRPLLRLAWGENLPFGLGFWPGGFDGFPGLKDGEGRGNRELMAALDVQRPLLGKLSFRALFAMGRTATDGPVIPQEPLLLGARAGLNLGTRFGLVRLEYGLATEHHRAVFIRLGRIL
jgi:hypothetical protein